MGKKKGGFSVVQKSQSKEAHPPNGSRTGSSSGATSSSSSTSISSQHGVPGLLKKEQSTESLTEVEGESSLEKLMNKVIDEPSLKTFAQAWNKEMELRKANWEANQNPNYEEFEKLIALKKLDSNLKKCSGFVKKVKLFSENQKTSIENDLKTLNLSKYLTEIAGAVSESRLKMDQVMDVVTVCSWVHQRYSEFSATLLENFKKNLPVKKVDVSTTSLSKLSVDLRMIAELVVGGVFPATAGVAAISSVIRCLVATDKEGQQCLIPLLSCVLGLGDTFLGVLSRKISCLCKEYNVILLRNETVPKEIKSNLRNSFVEYYSYISQTLLKLHQEKEKSELFNRKILKSKGEIPQERKESHVALEVKFDKYKTNATRYADAIDLDLPQLPELPEDPEYEEEKSFIRGVGAECSDQADTVPGIVLFDDEETRSFYQDFKDLKVYLPPVAYRETIQQAAQETKEIEEREKALKEEFDDLLEAAELEQDSPPTEEEVSEASSGDDLLPSSRQDTEEAAQIKETFREYLKKLLTCCNRTSIDNAALEFAENHNTKQNRKKLAKLVAILNPVMPDIGIELCRLLKSDMIYLVKKKHQTSIIETKLKIVRFIGELVNFRIFPKSDALHCIKILLMNFVHHQIEMACVLVETCGRVLFRTPDSHRRTKIYLDEMVRKKTVKSLEPRYVSMIDHACSVVIPRENAPRVMKKLTPIELYLAPILLEDLCRSTYKKTLALLKRINWEDAWMSEVACRYLTSPWRITHQQLQLQAELLRDLIRPEPRTVTRVIDIVIEEVRRGLEHPSVHYNHRRFSNVQYLSELYYYRLVRSDTLFDVMYLLITYGVTWDPSRNATMDPKDNIMRIKLAVFLLKDCGEYLLGHGPHRRRLRQYILHLQKYIWLKKSLPYWSTRNFPLGILESFIEIARRLYPKMRVAESYDEATEALDEVESGENNDKAEKGGGDRPREQDKFKMPKLLPVSETGDLFPELDPWLKLQELQGQNGRNEYGMGCDTILEEDEMDPYDLGSKRGVTPEDEEFNALLDKMCLLDFNSGVKMQTNISIPLHISNSADSTSAKAAVPLPEAGTVPFTLLTRGKGNKQQCKTLEMPADSELVQRIRTQAERERAEKENIKRRTLAMLQQQEAEERQQELEQINNSLYNNTMYSKTFYSSNARR